jgi:hypothetical protein
MPDSQHFVSTPPPPEIAPAPPTSRIAIIPELTPSPWDADAPREAFKCAICEDVGYEEYPEADTFVGILDKPLLDARETPHGYICSRSCMSQLMFQSADKSQQEKLLRFDRALAEISETPPDLQAMFDEWEMEIDTKLVSKVAHARIQLGCFERPGLPKWIETNEAPEVALQDAIRQALHELDWRVGIGLLSNLKCELGRIGDTNYDYPKASEYETGRSATMLASLGNVMLRLKAARNGEVIA